MMDESQLPKPKVLITKFSEEAIAKAIQSLETIEICFPPTQPVLIHIDSYGGAVDGLSMLYDKLTSMKNPIMTYTSSKAMSAGAILLATAGTKGMRMASPQATIMIHEIQAGAVGDIKDMEDQMVLCKVLNDRWMKILAKSMNLQGVSAIRALIKKKAIGHDVYLTADQAVKLGVIDVVGSITMTPFSGWNFVVVKGK
jgi:ATP-dependent Clp protease protease subunit